MIAVMCVSVANQDWSYAVSLPDVPFPGDEIVCGRWGSMRVVRRSYMCTDLPEQRDGADAALAGVILYVRQEGGSS